MTIMTKKTYQPSNIVMNNVITLRDELSGNYENLSIDCKVVLFKLNSCLFRDENGDARYEQSTQEQQSQFDQTNDVPIEL